MYIILPVFGFVRLLLINSSCTHTFLVRRLQVYTKIIMFLKVLRIHLGNVPFSWSLQNNGGIQVNVIEISTSLSLKSTLHVDRFLKKTLFETLQSHGILKMISFGAMFLLGRHNSPKLKSLQNASMASKELFWSNELYSTKNMACT